MFIPTIFFGQGETCTQIAISGSSLPTGVTYGQLDSGSDVSYFWMKVEAGSSVEFDVVGGTNNLCKLLLVGGGGYKDAGIVGGGSGGGAAGSVIWQDITLQPNRYFISASIGGRSTSQTGGSAQLITPYDEPDPLKRTLIVANGGGPNETANAGGDNDFYSGGTGITGPTEAGGGGGAGSRGNGQDGYVTPGTPNSRTGGDGGSGTTISSPFDTVVGYTIVGTGGPGDGDICGGGVADPSAYGNGGSSCNNTSDNGNDGVAILFIPIQKCELIPTGSILLPEDEPFQAIGGDLTGTFTSGSRDWRYHLYTTPSNVQPSYFSVTSGYTNEGKLIMVGGGAGGNGSGVSNWGGAGAGGVVIKRNVTLYGTYNCAVGKGGNKGIGTTGNPTNGSNTLFYPISTYVSYLGARGGGYGSNETTPGQTGGSGGGGGFWAGSYRSPGTSAVFTDKYGTQDEAYGNNGGNADGNGLGTYYGGGGGGAGSAGENGQTNRAGYGGSGYTLTGEFFPTAVLFATSSIARGGNGPYLGGVAQPYSGDGGNIDENGAGGFICITYPIT